MVEVFVSDVIESEMPAVWAVLRDFSNTAVWFPSIETCRQLNPEIGLAVGAIRAQKIRGVEGEGHEELIALDDENRRLSYRMTLTDAPIEDYVSEVHLVPVTRRGGTFVMWRSTFRTPGGEDEAMIALTTSVLTGAIDALRLHLGAASA